MKSRNNNFENPSMTISHIDEEKSKIATIRLNNYIKQAKCLLDDSKIS